MFRDFTPSTYNVRYSPYNASGDGIADDTAAFLACAADAVRDTAASAHVNGRYPVIYIPGGVYRLTQGLPTFTAPVSIVGDGHMKTIVSVDPVLSGDVLSWSECWFKSNFGSTLVTLPISTGVTVSGISLYGSRSSPNVQNGLAFYDRNDGVKLEDVECVCLTGRALSSGIIKNQVQAYLRESRLRDLRFFSCGGASSPVVEFNSAGTGDASNEISVENLDVFASYGPGLVIRNSNASNGGVRDLKFSRIRIEGLQNGVTAADLLQIGDPALSGLVSNLSFSQAELIDPYTGFSALAFYAASLAAAPSQVLFEGLVGGGAANGGGVNIQAGRNITLKLLGMHSTATNLTVASTTKCAGPILVDGYGEETSYTTNIDATMTSAVYSPTRQTGAL